MNKPKQTPLSLAAQLATKRLVIKLGTQVLTAAESENDNSENPFEPFVVDMATLHKQGKQILVVSSGAVGFGKKILNLKGDLTLLEKQACAAVGQNYLMQAYQASFTKHGITIAQVLLTAYDLSNRQRYLNLKETLEKLLEMGVIPIINENDCVSVAELQEQGKEKSFGDNDMLSALVASKLDANLLILLSNVDGIYDKNPFSHTDAKRIGCVEDVETLSAIDASGISEGGRGGMHSKLRAARLAAYSGVATIVASGLSPTVLSKIFTGDALACDIEGTLILPATKLSSKRRWLGFASGYEGIIIVNTCAVTALAEKNASLLPIGITNVVGQFQQDEVVSIQDEDGLEIGRGLARFSADDVRRIQGCHSSEIPVKLGRASGYVENDNDVVIHRDDLIIF